LSKADFYIAQLKMIPHPEGGYYCETFRSPHQADFMGFEGPRSYATSIYFLLKEGQTSALHRIKSDEIWYHHDGGTLTIIEIDENHQTQSIALGKQIHLGETLQHVVKAGRWFGAKLPPGSEFCLVGCQVSPGFDFRDFELKE
jgi:predicted cupin superfamily sugar epimerase